MKTLTLFYALGIIAILVIITFSIIMMMDNSVSERLQGIVNLLWLALPIATLTIDRLCVKKYGTAQVNFVEQGVLLGLIILFIVNWVRLRL